MVVGCRRIVELVGPGSVVLVVGSGKVEVGAGIVVVSAIGL